MLARSLSSAVYGIDADFVDVEVSISSGLPLCQIVGLPEASVKESKERVKSAISNSGYMFPQDRITVNLAPADLKKEGTGFDLPIAVGIIAAAGFIPSEILNQYLITGELSLDGRVKPVKGCLSMAMCARKTGLKGMILPVSNSREASVVSGLHIYPVNTLAQVIEFLRGYIKLTPEKLNYQDLLSDHSSFRSDFSEVMGQEHVKRALEISASGSHNVLMLGPPGSGKTMLARRMPGILPAMTFKEAVEATKIYSVSGMLKKSISLLTKRPFRSPHHTISDAGLTGGGHNPKPGEISLAHNGVLFLDEFPEFKKNVLEVLRQPLEDQQVTISRAAGRVTYPANFTLIGSMNPCPCGYLTDPANECRCSASQIQKYRSKISGPLLDRIDIHIEVPAVSFGDMMKKEPAESSEVIRKRVSETRSIQNERFKTHGIHSNGQMKNRHIKMYCQLNSGSNRILKIAVDKMGFSARACNRILKIGRTLADMSGCVEISTEHISEAIQYRTNDRERFY